MRVVSNSDPAVDFIDVTPDDDAEIDSGSDQDFKGARSLYIGSAGDVAVESPKGTSKVFKNVPVGFFPVRCVKVLETGTTAEEIMALF